MCIISLIGRGVQQVWGVRAQSLVRKRQGMEPQSIGDGVLGPLQERTYAIKAPSLRAPDLALAWASSWIDVMSRKEEGFSL